MKRLIVSLVLGFGVLAMAGGIAVASIPDEGGVIHGCIANKGGQLRVIDSSSAACKSSETALTWNQVGPQGPAGPATLPAAYEAKNPGEGAPVQTWDPADPSFALTPLVGLDLPAGNWSVFASIQIQSEASIPAHYYATCYLTWQPVAGTFADESASVSGDGASLQLLSMMTLVTLPEGGAVDLGCLDFSYSAARWSSAKIVAVQVGVVTMVP